MNFLLFRTLGSRFRRLRFSGRGLGQPPHHLSGKVLLDLVGLGEDDGFTGFRGGGDLEITIGNSVKLEHLVTV